jgi:hypothetical protein
MARKVNTERLKRWIHKRWIWKQKKYTRKEGGKNGNRKVYITGKYVAV